MKGNGAADHYLQREKAQIAILWVKSALKAPISGLSKNIIREICGYFGRCQYLYMFSEGKLIGFDVNDCKWRSIMRLSTPLDRFYMTSYAFVIISPAIFLICGGLTSPDKTCAHLIASDGTVLLLETMFTGRYAHAALYLPVLQTVYVFGGANNGRLESTERFSMLEQHWKEGSRLKAARAGVNATIYNELFYLCAGDSEGTVETYNWTTETTDLVSIRLPFPHNCVTVRLGDSWVSILDSMLCRWRLDGILYKKYRKSTLVSSTCPPVVRNEVIYFVSVGCVVGVDLDSGAETGKWPYLIGWRV